MKKLIVLAMALASFVPAAIIPCVTDQSINGGATTVNCPGATATPGFTITGITFQALGSWQDSSFGFTGTSAYSFAENSGDFAAGPLNGNAAGTNSANTGVLSAGPVGVSLASVSAFTVDATRTVTVGSVPFNATVSVQYITTETSNNTVPEPGTMALLGSALVGLGLVARRRK